MKKLIVYMNLKEVKPDIKSRVDRQYLKTTNTSSS